MPCKELVVVRLALMQLVLQHALVATVVRHDHFHLIFQKQLHFFQGNFEREVFYVPVTLLYEFFKLAFTAGVFFGESSEFLVIFQQRPSDIVRRNRHPYSSRLEMSIHIPVTINTILLTNQ
jgi:hypothetical protein